MNVANAIFSASRRN